MSSSLSIIHTAFRPDINNSRDCGSASIAWRDVFGTNAYTQTSDSRDKRDVLPNTMGLNFVNQLTPVSYKWNYVDEHGDYTDDKRYCGFIAQDVYAVITGMGMDMDTCDIIYNPSMVSNPEPDAPDKYTMRMQSIIPALVNSIQELDVAVSELQSSGAVQGIKRSGNTKGKKPVETANKVATSQQIKEITAQAAMNAITSVRKEMESEIAKVRDESVSATITAAKQMKAMRKEMESMKAEIAHIRKRDSTKEMAKMQAEIAQLKAEVAYLKAENLKQSMIEQKNELDAQTTLSDDFEEISELSA